ncbi:MAG TPA: hypothetical protein VKT82_33055 [Ktedonobacterales bacterium]|nr:hypothetical protein [Ktedonobacterales bacterium]
MTDFVPQPCNRWADLLAAHLDDLSIEERRALDAHVSSCRACAAVRADYQRMAAQIRGLPDPRTRPGFPPWLLALQEAARRDASAQPQIIPFHSLEKHMQMQKEPGRAVPAPTPGNQDQHPRRRVVSWVTAVAALVVIALITAALLASHAGKPSTTGHPGNTTTSSPAASKGWSSPPGLAHLSAQPVIAPSDPKTIYLMGSNPPVFLQRTTDEGAHWKKLSLPVQGSQPELLSIMVNAGDAQNIFLLLSFSQSSAACSGSQASSGQVNAYSGGGCQVPYYSTNGGDSWALMRCLLCAQTLYMSGSLAPVGNIFAQGDSLYSSFYDKNGNQHLIISTDDGATWKPADTSLLAQGQGACSFTAAPTGSAIFALVQAGQCAQPVGSVQQPVGALLSAATYPQAQSGVSVWRSDDAGAHWAQVSAFPSAQPDTASFQAVNTGGAQPTLFVGAGQGTSYTKLVSIDGGKTWQTLPTRGLPASASIFNLFPTALSNGAVLLSAQAISNGSGNLYAWKPGSSAWQRVTQPFTGAPIDLIIVPAAGGHETLWLSITDYRGNFSVLSCTI